MRWPWLRFRVRTFLVAVAIAALAMGAWQEVERLRIQAIVHAIVAGSHAQAVEMHTHPQKYDGCCGGYLSPPFKPDPRLDPILAEYHAHMQRKYEYAARYPWLSLPPDPPRPQ
jgi:hypothetical protein